MARVLTRVGRSLSEAQQAFLENPYVGIVTDVRPDGSLHSTVVWVDVDEDGVSFNTAWPRAKPRYLQANPNVALLVIDPGDEYRWISISGKATLNEDGADEQIDRLAKKYKGFDSYPWHKPEETRVSVRIAPTWIEARGIG